MMKEIDINKLKINPFQLFGKDWMALTAGTKKTGFNTMTIAWGHLGSVWERGSHRNCLPTAICYVRPSRYTKEYMDKELIDFNYPERDFHEMYVGEIVKVLVSDNRE